MDEVWKQSVKGIGLLNEKPLHASLKQWYSKPGDRFEVPVDGFVIDIVRDDLLIEIQTRNFAAIKSKLTSLVHSHRVRLIYPVVEEKWIVRSSAKRGGISRRKSPKKGRLEDLFQELVSIPHLLSSRNFSLEVVMIAEEEVRRYDGKRAWRRRGWVIESRRLVEVREQRLFEESSDWLRLLPRGLESFTTRDVATVMNTGSDLAQKVAYCLRQAMLIEMIGKQGRSNLYRVARAHQPPAEDPGFNGGLR